MAAAEWHGEAHCIRSTCDWRTDKRGISKDVGQPVDLAARKHMDAEGAGHSTCTGMHRVIYCSELGCSDVHG